MFKQGKTLIIIIAVIIVAFAVLKFNQLISPPQETQSTPSTSTEEQTLINTHNLVSDYLKAHINELSPQPTVVGGTFYVTNISWLDNDRAIVDYEDGHISLTARVSYILSAQEPLTITAFEVIKQNNELINQSTEKISDDDLAIVTIKNQLADKYEMDFTDITIVVQQKTKQHLRGTARLIDNEQEKQTTILATVVQGEWTIVYDGQPTFDCADITDYSFPEEVTPECVG